MAKPKAKDEYYIDPAQFKEEVLAFYETEDFDNRLYNSLGEKCLLLAKNFSSANSFRGYTFREDMVQEAVIKMSKTLVKGRETSRLTEEERKGYQPGKGDPFLYFSTIAKNAFLAMISSEKIRRERAAKIQEHQYEVELGDQENSDNLRAQTTEEEEDFYNNKLCGVPQNFNLEIAELERMRKNKRKRKV